MMAVMNSAYVYVFPHLQLGIILDRDRHKDTVTVEMSLSKEVLTLGYDDVCEHVSSEHY